MPQAAYVRCNYSKDNGSPLIEEVSMPQAAYVRCNRAFGSMVHSILSFQCRKRHMFVAT